MARLVSVAGSHVYGLVPVCLQFSISVAGTAKLSPPPSEPANRALGSENGGGSRARRHSCRERCGIVEEANEVVLSLECVADRLAEAAVRYSSGVGRLARVGSERS